MKTKNRALFSVSFFVLVTACSAPPVVNPSNLAQQWGDRLRAYQINPVFPPREDIQVGDIYLLCDLKPKMEAAAASEQSGQTPQSVWVTRINLSQTVENNYDAAISLPPLSAQNAKGALSDPNGFGSMPTVTNMVAGTRKLQQLRNVSFPEFFSASISSVQASALVPAGIVLAGLGLAKDDVAAISLSVPSAGSYGIPFIAAHLAFNNAIEHVGPDFWRYTTELKKEYASKCNKDQTASLQLVIEVFAAYAMDVNFTFEKGTAARMQAAINTPANSTRSATLQALTKQISDLQTSATSNSDSSGKGGGDKTTASGTKATTGKKAASGTKAASAADAASAASTPATAGPASEANAGGSQQTQIDQLNTPLNLLVQQAAGFEQQKFAGVSAQIVSGSSSGVRVERVFSNPVVIGYKSMTLLSPDAAQNTTGGQVVEPPDVNVVSTLPSTPTAPTHKNPRSPTRKPVTPSKNRASLNPHAEPQAAASDAVGPAAGRPNGGAAASVPISLGTALAKKGSAAGIPNFPSAATMLDLQ